MSHTILDITCPGCGAPVSTADKDCKYCGRPIIISTFNMVTSMTIPELKKYATTYEEALTNAPDDESLTVSAAMCYLKLKLYDKALAGFEKAINQNIGNSENYFYASICLLKGKKAFNINKLDIDKCLELINAAIDIEQKSIYYFFRSYIKYDFYERKYLTINPDFKEDLKSAKNRNLSTTDVELLFSILNVQVPQKLLEVIS